MHDRRLVQHPGMEDPRQHVYCEPYGQQQQQPVKLPMMTGQPPQLLPPSSSSSNSSSPFIIHHPHPIHPRTSPAGASGCSVRLTPAHQHLAMYHGYPTPDPQQEVLLPHHHYHPQPEMSPHPPPPLPATRPPSKRPGYALGVPHNGSVRSASGVRLGPHHPQRPGGGSLRGGTGHVRHYSGTDYMDGEHPRLVLRTDRCPDGEDCYGGVNVPNECTDPTTQHYYHELYHNDDGKRKQPSVYTIPGYIAYTLSRGNPDGHVTPHQHCQEPNYKGGSDALSSLDLTAPLKPKSGTDCLTPSSTSSSGDSSTTGTYATLQKGPWFRRCKLRFVSAVGRKQKHRSRNRDPGSDSAKSPTLGRRTCALLTILVFSVCLLFFAVGVALYLTVGGGLSVFSAKSSHVRFEVPHPPTVDGSFRVINVVYSDDLMDKGTSIQYVQLEEDLVNAIDDIFSSSAITGVYNRTEILGFRNSSDARGVSVEIRAHLNNTIAGAAEAVATAFVRGLVNNPHVYGTVLLDRYVVDVNSIQFTESAPDGRLHFVQAALSEVDTAWSSWSPWTPCGPEACTRGRARGGVETQVRTRDCRINNGTGALLPDNQECIRRYGGLRFEIRPCPCPTPPTTPLQRGIITEETDNKTVSNRVDSNVNRVPNSATNPLDTNVAHTPNGIPNEPVPQPIPPVTTNATSSAPKGGTNKDNPERGRSCFECTPSEICIAKHSEREPTCRPILDSNDESGCNGWCDVRYEYCQRLATGSYRCIDDRLCLPNEWQCGDGLCIPAEKRCDGHFNCYDTSDELNCDCDEQQFFRCGKNTSCLPRHKRCDRVIDCWDGSDEENCTKQCPGAQFTCNDGQCIPTLYFCDGLADCRDESDEPGGCNVTTCLADELRCNNGRCIKRAFLCDGVDTCGDGTDERNCRSGATSGRESEMGTIGSRRAALVAAAARAAAARAAAARGTYDIDPSVLFNNSRVNGRRPASLSSTPAMFNSRMLLSLLPCPGTDSVVCDNGRCIQYSQLCNGIDDCGDNSDEKCPRTSKNEIST